MLIPRLDSPVTSDAFAFWQARFFLGIVIIKRFCDIPQTRLIGGDEKFRRIMFSEIYLGGGLALS